MNNLNNKTKKIEIASFDDGYKPKMLVEFKKALKENKKAQSVWNNTTPIARRDWLLWMISGKLEETQGIRIKKTLSMLSSGKKRVCCFGGYNWMNKKKES